MTLELLNPNQQRHLGVMLRLLAEDFVDLEFHIPSGEWGAEARRRIGDVRKEALGILETFGLAQAGTRDPVRQTATLCGAWLAHLHDLRAVRLSAYGAVAPELSGQLDPRLSDLEGALNRLLTLTREAPK